MILTLQVVGCSREMPQRPQLNKCSCAVPEFTSGHQLPQPLRTKLTFPQCRVLDTGSCAAKPFFGGGVPSPHN